MSEFFRVVNNDDPYLSRGMSGNFRLIAEDNWEDAYKSEGWYVISDDLSRGEYDPVHWIYSDVDFRKELCGIEAAVEYCGCGNYPDDETVEMDECNPDEYWDAILADEVSLSSAAIKRVRTKSAFKALRESVGYSQQGLVDALNDDISKVERWEEPVFDMSGDDYELRKDNCIPDYAWSHLEFVAAYQQDCLGSWLSAVEQEVKEMGENPTPVTVVYYRDQKMADECPDECGNYLEIPFDWANAIARKLAYELERRGIAYEFRYPNEEASRTYPYDVAKGK